MAKFLAFVLRPLVYNTKHNVQNSFDLVEAINYSITITLKPEETIISYDVVGLPASSAIDVVHQALLKDSALSSRTKFVL